jgi:hypothetical protein
MKNFRFLTFVLTIAALLLSACGAAASTATPAAESAVQNVDAMPVAFVGIVDSIAGDQWVISGTTVTVDESIVRDGPFNIGDRIKVEGYVNPDGSFTVSRVETPTPQEVLTATPFVVDDSNETNANANVNDGNSNDDNSNGVNSNDDNSNTANSNDDNGGGNSNDDNSNTVNSNDDNGGGNSNDDNSNTASSNDDSGGGNSNDDNSNTANSNDDNGGGNSNDDSGNSNDDNGGGGNSNDDNGNGG